MRGGAPSLWYSALGRAAAVVQVREDKVLVHSFPGHPDKVQMFWKDTELGRHWATPTLTSSLSASPQDWLQHIQTPGKVNGLRVVALEFPEKGQCQVVALPPTSAPASPNKAFLQTHISASVPFPHHWPLLPLSLKAIV